MDWLQFFSSLAWPAVAAVALLTFRKPLRSWLALRPSKLKAGPVEVVWDEAVDKAVAELESAQAAAPVEETFGSVDPSGLPQDSLAIRLREVARVAPAGAIMEASREVEIALRDLLRKSGVDERVIARVGIQGLTRSVAEKGLLPRTIAVLQSLIKLRNLAAHGPDQLEPWQAYEFMSLADLVLAEARQQEAAADRVFSPDRPAG